MLGERAVTDQIFLHSKMMLVDDRVAIIGSNNVRAAVASAVGV